MYKTINFFQFCDEWNLWEDRKATFSYEGKKALFEYLDQLENYELDIIALCCDWTEYDSLDDVKDSYDDIKTLKDLEARTTVLECDNGHLVVGNY